MTETLAAACRTVLLTAEPAAKLMAARRVARDWRLGRIDHDFDVAMPDAPARPARPELLPPGRMPRRGRAGSARARIAMLHALAHIEFVAIDLAFDLVGRFGGEFPRGFADDWLAVGADEAMHFALLDRRLATLGSGYGALPAHGGLWASAAATARDPLARLAIVPMVLEARGLDVTPDMIARFEAVEDTGSARILARIYQDEIRHVAAGTHWFRFGCQVIRADPVRKWQSLVAEHFSGGLRPPFNDSARRQAGLTRDYYMSVA